MVIPARQQLGCQSVVFPMADLSSAVLWLLQLQTKQEVWELWGTNDLRMELKVVFAKQPTQGATSNTFLNLCWDMCFPH